MRESKVEKYLVAEVKKLGGETNKVTWPGRRGAPDRLVMLPEFRSRGPAGLIPTERFLVETKAPDGVLKPHQKREHKRLRKFGWRVEVAYDFDNVKRILR